MNEAYELVTAIKEVAETRLRLKEEVRDNNLYGAGLELLAFERSTGFFDKCYLYDIRHEFSRTFPGMIRMLGVAAPFTYYWGCQIGSSDLLEMIKTDSEYPVFYIYHNAILIGEIHQLAPKRTLERVLKIIWDAFWKTGWRSLWKLPGDRFDVFVDGKTFGTFQIPHCFSHENAVFDLKLNDGRVLLLTGTTRAGWEVSWQLDEEDSTDKVIPTRYAKLTARQMQVYAATNILLRVDLVCASDD